MPKSSTLLILYAAAVLLHASSAKGGITVYVCNGNNNNQIEKFDSNGVGSVFASSGLNNPFGLAGDSAGNLYVANTAEYNSNGYILRFTADGVGSLFAGMVNAPTGLAFDRDGNLYAANAQNGSIEKFTPSGGRTIFAQDPGNNSVLWSPYGLAFDTAGNLYAANFSSNTITKFTPNGVPSLFASTGLQNPEGLAFDREGNLFVANYGSHTITKFTPGGVGSVFANTGLTNPSGLAFDDAGNLYAVNTDQASPNGSITKFTPNGVGSVFAETAFPYPNFIAIFPEPFPVSAIQFVTVGNPGNSADSQNSGVVPGIGTATYKFKIATTEITIGQYSEFLNAVARTDTHGLYHPDMGTNGTNGNNIIQSGSPGNFTYTVQGIDAPNLPVTFVDWYDTLRFANWMHNGQPNTGSQSAATTENGAYTFSGTTTVGGRNLGARFFLPTENEWYKAAYFDPTLGAGGYWLYPFQTDSVPFSDNPFSLNTPDNTRAANFNKDDGIANGYNDGFAVSGSTIFPSGDALTPVRAYAEATSFYGAFDMGGNVFEWNESVVTGLRGIRGGSWFDSEAKMHSSDRLNQDAQFERNFIGFRIAMFVDTDGDGLSDGDEMNVLGTNPLDADTDNDGLTDGQEVLTYGTNPLLADTDLDGFNDKAEIESGKDPLDINDNPDAVVEIYTSVEFLFYSELGASYQVQWSINLSDWFTFPEVIPGTGDAITRLYSTRTEPKRYFRAEKTSP